jgi:hypothetical protein
MYGDVPSMPTATFTFEPTPETSSASISFIDIVLIHTRTCAYLVPCLVATFASGRAFSLFACFLVDFGHKESL